MKRLIYRAIDANFNRAREGLRVCEEFARFFLNDRPLTKGFKIARRQVSKLYHKFFTARESLFLARDVAGDVGKKGFSFEKKRSRPADIFWANIQRSKEALRVLEEFSKLIDKRLSDNFRRLRFKVYELEKKTFSRLLLKR